MGAAKVYDVGRAARAPIEREVFTHGSNRRCLSGFKFFRYINRLPKPPQVPPGQSSRAGMDGIHVVKVWLQLIGGRHVESYFRSILVSSFSKAVSSV